MCRWLAYSGSPVLLEDLLYKPENSLVVQSLHSSMGADDDQRRRLRRRLVRRRRDARACSAAPSRPGTTATCASSAPHVSSRRVFAHIRASTGLARCSRRTATRSATGSWLWMHNGVLAGLPRR